MAQTNPRTVGETLYFSYANIAMARRAVTQRERTYSKVLYGVRAKLYKGLKEGTMNLGPLSDDERVKLTQEKACCYCGSRAKLTLDHFLPRKAGGTDSGDNLVWACRSCNSSKGAKDLLEWYEYRGEFPPLLLLRRYLKIAIHYCREHGYIDGSLDDHDLMARIPFSIERVPFHPPPPTELVMWVEPIPSSSDARLHE